MDLAVVRPVLEQLKFQSILVKIDLLFEACDKLADADKKVLFEEMRIRLVKRIGSADLGAAKHQLATGEIEQPLLNAFAELFDGRA
jgi:hypothetical protein